MQAALSDLEYYLPERALSTEDLSGEFPEWQVEKIDDKTGIRERHIAGPDECSSDLAVAAAQKLFSSAACDPQSIDYLLLCTQTPDYFLPPTACLVQDRLGIPRSAGAFDFNLGSSGYVYGLGLVQGLMASGQASTALLITTDTYSKLIHPQDKSVRTIFGDGATATLLRAVESDTPLVGPFVYGTDGSGASNLIVPAGGMRRPRSAATSVAIEDGNGNVRSADNLFMNGPEIFNFTLSIVPDMIRDILKRADRTLEQIDLFIFHQANQYMLEHLRKRLKIPREKFYVAMSHGNTVSSSIPIALKDACSDHRLAPGATLMLVGFGVGYSWAATLVRWTGSGA